MMQHAVVIAAVGAIVTLTTPALADPPNGPTTASAVDIDIDLTLGWNSFRLGGRLFGPQGSAGGVWLNGETRRDGFSLDGRIERDGKAHRFKLDADLDEWVQRAIRWGAIGL